MDTQILQPSVERVLALAARQHGVVTRAQLLELGMDPQAIKHRVRRGRLHAVQRGVYAVGRPQLTRLGTLIAAVLACGPDAALSHEQAAEVYGIRRRRFGQIEVTVPPSVNRKRVGLRIHRRALPDAERSTHRGIPITTPIRTLVDLADRLPKPELEAAVNEADKLDLVKTDQLRYSLEHMNGRRGVPALRELLDRRTFVLTHTELERRFVPIALSAGLPLPATQQWLGEGRVDFHWPELRLVVETDGLRYHRTPAQQAVDHRRDQEHIAAGMTPLRFTHEQVVYEAQRVETVLARVARRLK